MNWYCIILLLVIVCGCSKSTQEFYVDPPKLVSINIIDRNGLSETISNPDRLEQYSCVDFLQPQPYQKVLRVYSRDQQGNIPACITSYHTNGYTKQYLEVVNSRACGVYQEWYPNGQQKIQAKVIEGSADLSLGSEKTWIFDETCMVWSESGQLQASIPYVKGKLNGTSVYFHKEDCIWKIIPFCQGNLDGVTEVYCPDGMLLQSIKYCQGLRDGKACRYWTPEQLAAEETYCEGLLVSANYYDKDGSCLSTIEEGNGIKTVFGKDAVCETHEYHYGVLDGEVKVFDRYGRINNTYHVKNGCKHGEELCYYDAVRLQLKLNPKLSMSWFEGKVQGVCKTWYPNGVQESQKEMSNNKKNGHSTAWFDDGSLMLIEEYEQDKLIRGEYYCKGDRLPVSGIDDGKGIASLYDANGNFRQKIEYRNGKPEID